MSIPFGFVVVLLLALFGSGLITGWLLANARWKRRLSGDRPDETTHAKYFLNALPQAAVVADVNANILVSNPLAHSVLQGFDGLGALPMSIGTAVQRVIYSQVAEVLEVARPGDTTARLHASVLPLQPGQPHATALVLFTEPKAGSGRTQVYKRLMDVIAHELRTPLTAISGHVEILSSCRIDEETLWRRSLGFVSREVERLAKLVEDLLSLSRLDHIPVHIQVVNLRLAAEQALSDLYERAEQQGVTLVLQAPPELPRVQADPDRIRQVFLNLVHNAIKYAPGSVVTIQLVSSGSQLQVEVRDTGPGIPPQDLPHIFEPLFRSADAPAGVEGNGLGLAIVRLILDQHNVPVNVNSALGQGTVFRFGLPVVYTPETPPMGIRPVA